VVREVARRYLDAVRDRETLAFIGEQRDGLRQVVTALERRVAEGVAAEADLRKFEMELERVETEALRVDLDLARARNELAAWLSLPALTPGELAMPLPRVPAPPDDAGLDAAIDGRLDVALARARLTTAERAADVQRARGRPDLVVSGGYKRTAGLDTGLVGVSVAVPLADRNRAAVARAEAEVRAAALEVEAMRALARADAVASVTRAQALAARAERAATALVVPATIVRSAARAAFREGAFDALRLVDAERAWTEARRTQVTLRLDAAIAALDARIALGMEAVP
jgi:cobalt-zinc-cadmium efflux system outer membrane protein